MNIDRKRWSCTFRQEDWEANISAFVLDSMSSLSIVENRWFRKIFDGITFFAYDNINRFAWVRYFLNHSVDFNIKKNGITVKHMTRYSLMKKIKRSFEDHLSELKRIMETTEYVCTTADAWSGKRRRFLGVTLHWVSFVNVSVCTLFYSHHYNLHCALLRLHKLPLWARKPSLFEFSFFFLDSEIKK